MAYNYDLVITRPFVITGSQGPVTAGDQSRQASLLSLRTLPERQPAGPIEKRSFVTPSKV